MSDRVLRVGVIGVDRDGRGFGARAHLPGVRAARGVELVAVCTAHEETARAAAGRWEVPRAYWDVEQLVRDPDVDLVTVATRVRWHLPLVWSALRAGKMVYCEWPLGLNAGEAQLLADLAARTGVLTAVGTQGRFAPGILYMRDLIARGAIGRPLFFHLTHFLPRFSVRSDHWWSATEEEHSGALGVAAAHATDSLQAVLGPVEAVSGTAETLRPEDRYTDTGEPFRWTAMDTVGYQALLRGGVSGTAHVSNLSTHQIGFRLDVFGEAGHLAATAPYYVSYSPVSLTLVEPGDAGPRPVPIPTDYVWLDGLPEDSPGFNVGQALVAVRRAWVEGTPFRPDFAEGMRLHRLIDAIRTSSRLRRWVRLDDGGEGPPS